MATRDTVIIGVIIALLVGLQAASGADAGLITKPSKYSVLDTIERFEMAVNARGWVVFTELDHAAAAAKVGFNCDPEPSSCSAIQSSARGPCRRLPRWPSTIR